jgi:hypothetical protein
VGQDTEKRKHKEERKNEGQNRMRRKDEKKWYCVLFNDFVNI